jgi:hypothetical protein
MKPMKKREGSEPQFGGVMKGPEELAKEHFGDVEGLLVVRAQKVELAQHYAAKFDLSLDDPDVSTTAMLLAWTRFREFALIQASEQKIYDEVARSGLSYGDALYKVIQGETQKRVLLEIRRLHEQSKGLTSDLKGLSNQSDTSDKP